MKGEDSTAWRRRAASAAGVLAVFIILIWLDRSLASWLRSADAPGLRALVQGITSLGNGLVDLALALLVLAGGLLGGSLKAKALGARAFVAVLLAGLGVEVAKVLACRARPTVPDAGVFFISVPCLRAGWGYHSFPSGHATTAFALACVLGLGFPERRAAFYALAALVALSRVMLGAHFPSDVFAGALLGWAIGRVIGSPLRARVGPSAATPRQGS